MTTLTVPRRPDGKADVPDGTSYRVVSATADTLTIEVPDPTIDDARILLATLDAEQRLTAIADTVTPEHARILAPLLPAWTAGETVTDGALRSHDGTIWEVIPGQGHTTLPDWTPPATPALWRRWRDPDPDTPEPWIQPTGAHDAYRLGDLVAHNGATWRSDHDANIWEPGVAMWTRLDT